MVPGVSSPEQQPPRHKMMLPEHRCGGWQERGRHGPRPGTGVLDAQRGTALRPYRRPHVPLTTAHQPDDRLARDRDRRDTVRANQPAGQPDPSRRSAGSSAAPRLHRTAGRPRRRPAGRPRRRRAASRRIHQHHRGTRAHPADRHLRQPPPRLRGRAGRSEHAGPLRTPPARPGRRTLQLARR
jgi:hypothetical protein